MATIAEVRKAFESGLSEMFLLDQALNAERAAIKKKAFKEDRDLTAEERARRKEIAATRTELADAMQELSLNTIEQLETADEVKHILTKLKEFNTSLKDDLDRLKQLERYAETAAKVAAGLAGMATTLASLAV